MAGAFSAHVVYLAMCYLVFGTAQTISLKFTERVSSRGRYESNDAASPTWLNESATFLPSFTEANFYFVFNFAHPFAQALFMFTAEALCLIVLWGQCCYTKRIPVSKPHHPLVYLVPAASDFFASIIQNIGLFLTYASVYQMLRGATVVWIAIFSYFVFGRLYHKIEKWGVGFVMLGLTLVGMSSVYYNRAGQPQQVYPHQMLGNLLIVVAQILHAVQGVAEERLMVLYNLPPLQVVGMEGIFGVSLSLILLALLQVFPLSRWGSNVSGLVVEEYMQNSNPPHVTYWDRPNTTALLELLQASSGKNSTEFYPIVPYDDIHLVFTQIRHSFACLLCVLMYISSGLVYNVAQISIIKLLSASATVMVGSLRNISVWFVCLVLPYFNESLNPIQLLGFCFLILGNVLFQGVVYRSFEEFLPMPLVRACPLLFVDRHETAEVTITELVDTSRVTPPSAARPDETAGDQKVE